MISALIFGILAISFLPVDQAFSANATELKMATYFTDLALVPVYVADKLGFYGSMKIQPVKMSAGQVSAALENKSVDVHSFATPGVTAVDAGLDVKMIMALVENFTASLVCSPDVNSLADLAGRKVAVHAVNFQPHRLMEYALRNAGVDPKNVDFRAAGNSANRLAALKSGAVSCAVLYPPYDSYAKRLGFKVLLNGYDFPRQPDQAFWVKGSDLNDAARRAQFQVLVSGTLKAIGWLNDPKNKAEAMALIIEAMGLEKMADGLLADLEKKFGKKPGMDVNDVAADMAKEIYNDGRRMWSRTGRFTADEARTLAELTLGRPVSDPGKYFDLSLLP